MDTSPKDEPPRGYGTPDVLRMATSARAPIGLRILRTLRRVLIVALVVYVGYYVYYRIACTSRISLQVTRVAEDGQSSSTSEDARYTRFRRNSRINMAWYYLSQPARKIDKLLTGRQSRVLPK